MLVTYKGLTYKALAKAYAPKRKKDLYLVIVPDHYKGGIGLEYQYIRGEDQKDLRDIIVDVFGSVNNVPLNIKFAFISCADIDLPQTIEQLMTDLSKEVK